MKLYEVIVGEMNYMELPWGEFVEYERKLFSTYEKAIAYSREAWDHYGSNDDVTVEIAERSVEA